MGIKKIAYFVYFTEDMERAKNFYTRVLGLEIEQDAGTWVQFKLEGGTFALHQRDKAHADFKNQGGGVIGLEVDNIERLAEDLKRQNVSFHNGVLENDFGKLLYVSDPDDNIINFFEPARVAAHIH